MRKSKRMDAQLKTRGLWDSFSAPSPSAALNAVDSGLRSARDQGTRAVRSVAGAGTELATGINPNTVYEMGQEAMKKAIRGARYGTEVVYDAADKTLDTMQSLHDKKKDLVESYVKPNAPDMVNNVIDRVNTGFDSTLASIKDRVHQGRSVAQSTLDQLEEKLENGESIMPSAVQDGVQRVGKMLAPMADSVQGWVNGWMQPAAGAAAPAKPMTDEEIKVEDENMFADFAKPTRTDRVEEAMRAAKAAEEARIKAAEEAKAAAEAKAAEEAKAAQAAIPITPMPLRRMRSPAAMRGAPGIRSRSFRGSRLGGMSGR
ncbi:unnamed protein product [Bemisia tabaci]|uniref:Uncharacterized protein n=1 Tax=Bemisia tabaci TaxID=7038 RepID=A0A9P0G505_BEMTA|nr:unnamed protein product [Bemisia tabaci]